MAALTESTLRMLTNTGTYPESANGTIGLMPRQNSDPLSLLAIRMSVVSGSLA